MLSRFELSGFDHASCAQSLEAAMLPSPLRVTCFEENAKNSAFRELSRDIYTQIFEGSTGSADQKEEAGLAAGHPGGHVDGRSGEH